MQQDLELGLIGCILCEPSLIPGLKADFTDEDFTAPQAQKLFREAVKLHESGNVIDILTIVAAAGSECRNYALAAAEFPSVIAHFDYYRESALEEKRRLAAISISRGISESLLFGGDLLEAQAEAARLVETLTESADGDELTLRQGRIEFIVRQGEPIDYIPTGFSSLDKGLYIGKGDYIIIGGRPSSGKTAFALNLATHMARRKNVVFFSLETSKEKIIDRMMTSIFDLKYTEVKERKLGREKAREIIDKRALSDDLHFTVVAAAGRSVAWIQAKAQKLKADVVIIDYLGLIAGQKGSRYEQVTEISVGLHTMAQRTGMVVIALCQLNRLDEDKPPTMTSLRESGQIEQDADIIIFLHKEKDPKRRNVLIAKNKEGVMAAVELAFDGARQTFYELSEYSEIEREWPEVEK